MTGGPSTLTFPELHHQMAQTDAVAEGYEIQHVIRWGDPVLPQAPAFDPMRQTAQAQALQFGFNNDFLDFIPLPRGSNGSDHGLLWVNHEYTSTPIMFPSTDGRPVSNRRTTAEQVAVEMMAHGGSLVEIRRVDGRWQTLPAGPLNRRITAETPMRLSGPAAGHPRMRTGSDATGTRVLGMLNQCAGGNTPWGTVLTTEENFNAYFSGEAAANGEQAQAYLRDNTALSNHEIETEVDRYIAWPGQALSYYLGAMAIEDGRARAEAALGAKFNLRAFHDTVLQLGSVPLPILTARIDQFIADGGKGPYPDME
jgi:secreted PhoX family phosphatase